MLRILSIDDDPMIRTFVRVALESVGHEVVALSSGHEALQLLKEEKFDLILLDLMLLGADGNEFLDELRNSTSLPDKNTPVILLTGLANDLRRDHDLSTMLNKPVVLQDLVDKVHEAMAEKTTL